MITGELKNKVDKIWEMFWTGGITNPLDVIEQITYLIFIRDLDILDSKNALAARMLHQPFTSLFDDQHQLCRWSQFKNLSAERMYDVMSKQIFPFIKELHADKNSAYSKYMADAIFKIPTAQLLESIITAMDQIEWKNADIRGDLYEYLLSKLATSGTNGQFRTPRHIIKMMVSLVEPNPQDVIADPACGTSGFLVGAGEYLKEHYKNEINYKADIKKHFNDEMFYGYDMDRTMLRIGAMNMMTHGIENPHIEYKDSLSDQNTDTNRYSLILANPPFKGSLNYDVVSEDLLKVVKTKKTELLFLALFLRMLQTGGRCACIVPDGVLFGASKAHRALRQEIVEQHRLQAVISMPSGVFKPYAGVSTAVLVFTKTGAGGTDKVWFYDMQADGFSLDDKRTPVKENDIPDIVERFHHMEQEADRKRTDKSFLVPKQEIVDNDYDLTINKYKEIEYKPVQYEPTSVILDKIDGLEKEIQQNLSELRALLKDED